MDRIFSAVLQTGIYSLGIILIIVLLRIAFKKRASRKVLCALWIFVAIRLMIPFQIESSFALLPDISLINSFENTFNIENEGKDIADVDTLLNNKAPVSVPEVSKYVTENNRVTQNVKTSSEISADPELWENRITETNDLQTSKSISAENKDSSVTTKSTDTKSIAYVFSVLGYIWLLGAAVFILLMIRRYVKVRRKLKSAVLISPYDNVYSGEAISSAFVFGVLSPRIYVSALIGNKQLDYVLAHERAHIRRKDNITKLFAYLLLSVYWFVPWVWAAYILFGRDVELACDESVIAEKSGTYRADYAQVLLDNTIKYSHKEAGLVSFGEEKIKDRIESVVNYKKKSLWVSLAVILAAGLGLMIFFFVKASGSESEIKDQQQQSEKRSEIRDQQQQNLIEALESEYLDFSQNIGDSIVEDYKKLDEMDDIERWTSSHISGSCMETFSTWEETVEFIGVTPWNPFENADWLAATTKNKIYRTEFMGGRDGEPEHIGLMNSYTLESGHIDYCINLFCKIRSSAWPEEDAGDVISVSFKVGNAEEKKNVSADIRFASTDKYDAITIAFPNVYNYKLMFNIVSLSGTDDLSEMFDNVCKTIGLPTDYKDIEQKRHSSSGTEEPVNKAETEEPENTAYKPETELDMIPIDTDLDGAHNGFYVVPIDGKKYRYKIASARNESVTVGDKVYKWENKGNIFEFYVVKEYPDLKRLKCISTENGFNSDFLIEYAPPSGLPEGSLDEIINDGFVVMKNGSVISGEDKWQEFVKKTEAKEPAEINIAYYFTLTGKMAKNLYELSKMDYPRAYLHRLKYDGESFIVSPIQKIDGKYEVMPDDENDREQIYKYMKHYTEKAPSDTALYNTFDKYVLVNDDSVTWDDIWNSTIGIAEGFWHEEVYNKSDYKEGADPEKVTTVDIDF